MEWMGLAGGATLTTRWLRAAKPQVGEPPMAPPGSENATSSANISGNTRWARRAQEKLAKTKDITWLTHEPIDFVLRRGDHFDNEPDHYAKMLDPENIKRMAAAGIIYGRIFFYKGFGDRKRVV